MLFLLETFSIPSPPPDEDEGGTEGLLLSLVDVRSILTMISL